MTGRARHRAASPDEAEGASLDAKLARCADCLIELYDDALDAGLPVQQAFDLMAPHADMLAVIAIVHAVKRRRGAAPAGARSDGRA